MIKQKLHEKANYFVAGLFVLISICFANTAYADNKQDIADLEAFYHLVFDQNPTPKKSEKSQPKKINKRTIRKVQKAGKASITKKTQEVKEVPPAKQTSSNAKEPISFETNQNIDDKDPELVAFYEQVFGKKQIILKQKVKNKKSRLSKTHSKTPLIKSQTFLEEKPVEAEGKVRNTSKRRLSISQNIEEQQEESLSRQKVKNTKIRLSKSHTNTPLINSQTSKVDKPIETKQENVRVIPKKSLSISQNIVEQKEESLSSDDAPSAQSSDLAALFAKAFGRKAKALPPEINVDLRINKENLGDVVVYSNKQRNKINSVQTETLLVLLEDILKEHVFKRTKDEISKTDKVTFNTLNKLGVIATYNSSELSLDLQIDSALRKPQILTFRKRFNGGFTRDENKIEASEASAFVNMFSNVGLRSGANPDLKLKFESSFNLRGATLESDTTYINEEWNSGDTRLTYDEPDKLKRYILGNISTGNRNFQENIQLKGLRISKEFFMDPELQLRPRGNESFELETDSEVEVYINNRLQQRFHLKRGIYSLQDIGLNHGANNIRVRIKDEFGKVTEKSSLQFYDSHLLKPGLSLYAFSVGILSNEEAYNDQLKHEPITSAYYQRGLSKTVTMSIDAQITPNSYLLGSETIASVPFGSIKHSLGFSGGKDKDVGFATRFEFKPNIKRQLIGLDTLREDLLELDTSIGRFLTGWSISGEYRNKDFAMISEVPLPGVKNNKLRANLQTQFGLVLGDHWLGALSLSASDYYDSDKDLTASLTASRRFNNGVRLNIGAHYDSDNDFSMNMQLSIPLSREKHKRIKDLDILANSNGNSYTSRLSVQPKSLLGKDSLSGSLEYQQTESNRYQKIDFAYNDTQFDALLNAQLNNTSNSQQMSIGFNSSLLCVGKNCAISRPVNDSFALISGPENQTSPIAINRGSGNFKYSSDNETDLPDNYTALIPKKGSHAVLALDSYRYQRVNVDESTLPNGYDTEKTEFEVFPRYHQGFLIKAGGEASVILDGVLVDKSMKPLPYKGGQWVSMLDEGKVIAFFSNKVGRFRITSIPAGKYKLELFDYPDLKSININVPDKKGEVYDTGHLVVSE